MTDCIETPLCRRCHKQDATVTSRKEIFCNDCFQKFVSAKQRKQMMSEPYFQDVFKVLYQDKLRSALEADLMNKQSKILVPLSFGSSSLVMLDILNDTLTEQKETQRGNTGFQIDILVCLRNEEDLVGFQRLAKQLQDIKYASNKENISFHFISIESFYGSCNDNLQTIILNDQDYTPLAVSENVDPSKCSTVADLLAQCPDKSSREDLLWIIMRYLIKKFAYHHDHKAILWGHSMTKLADEAISMVVKGRGAQIAPLLDEAEFEHTFGNKFKSLYPLKDVLLSEVDAYCCIKGLDSFLVDYVPQDTLLLEARAANKTKTLKSIKSLSINEIARKYFDDVQGDYSNVISTVVRTAYKLSEPKFSEYSGTTCAICLANINSDAPSWLGAITVSDSHPIETEEESLLYEKWKDSKLGSEVMEYVEFKDYISKNGVKSTLCYGCLINTNRMRNKKILWPVLDKTELQCTLDQFELRDDEV